MSSFVLVLNSGSSSFKFQLYAASTEEVLVAGIYEGIGFDSGMFSAITDTKTQQEGQWKNHEEALHHLFEYIVSQEIIENQQQITGVGHRVVHGGEIYPESVEIDEDVISNIQNLSALAPLHNPANLSGIKICQKLLPTAKQVAVFDTSFHQTIAEEDYLYAIPRRFYDQYKIRKYGFHGTSFQYLTQRASEIFSKPVSDLNLILCHLGNGASMCAVKNGVSIDTTMGFTPLDGLIMGTRSGSIDPSIVSFIAEQEGISAAEVLTILNKESGMLALSDVSYDMREIKKSMNEGDPKAAKAFNKYIKTIQKQIGAYMTLFSSLDGVIFTAGVGENDSLVRSTICKNLEHMGLSLDESQNQKRGEELIISSLNSKVPVLVIPTNEELMIMREVKRFF